MGHTETWATGRGLEGKVVAVTGASSGLGAAFAEAFVAAGATVAAGARRVDRLDDLAKRLAGGRGGIVPLALDVTQPASCTAFADTVAQRVGRIDVLVNNAGVGWATPASREDPEATARVFATNVLGAISMAQACVRHMPRGSSIVNISSVLARTTFAAPQASYCASKAAIEGFTRDLAQQWSGRKGIRVNAVAPGLFPSEMSDEYPEDFLADLVERRMPMGRLGEPHECAAAVLFLASDAASYITGAVLPVDGGLLVT